ncbi:MAG: Holliday junction branch migration protein RuvA [bacterium]|nr:Holliday junction branch migration protein RuvA [bacterium]
MIGKIKGIVSEIENNLALIETASGVFYQVFLPASLISKATAGSLIEVYTYLQIRDDAHVLFGFETKEQHRMFILLLSVSGVGPKTAFSVLSYSKVEGIVNSVKENNIAYLEKIPGLGKKTAMKIMLELSQKLDQTFKLEKMYMSEEDKIVIDALISLGFSSQDARKLLPTFPKELTLEQKITYALRKIKPK